MAAEMYITVYKDAKAGRGQCSSGTGGPTGGWVSLVAPAATWSHSGVGRLRRRLHVDGAHAGVAAILPEQRHHFAGVELADSFNTNPHKWLLTTFDCSCIWFRDADPLKAALSLTPAYLRGKGNAYDYQVT